jgi:glyoxylase I family protein
MAYVVGSIQHPGEDRQPFDERRPGLDHLALHVPEQLELEDWARHLDELGIEHSGVKRVPYEDVITLRDPHIQLEICWPNTDWWARQLSSAL